MKALQQFAIALSLSALIAPGLAQACPDYRTSAHWGCTGKDCQTCKSSKPQPAPRQQLSQIPKDGGKRTRPVPAEALKKPKQRAKAILPPPIRKS